MIPPGTRTIRDLQVGDIVKGTVTRIENYGAFVDIGIGKDALLHVREMAEGYVRHPADIVEVGEEIEAKVVQVDVRRNRVDLSLKGLREEESEPEAVDSVALEEVAEDEEEEILSPVQIAFLQAQAMREQRREKKRRKKRWDEFANDEILQETLKYARSDEE